MAEIGFEFRDIRFQKPYSFYYTLLMIPLSKVNVTLITNIRKNNPKE